MTKEKLSTRQKLSLHFADAKKGAGDRDYAGKAGRVQLKDDLSQELHRFARDIQLTRLGQNEKGEKIASGADISFADATKEYFGCDVKTLLHSLGVKTSQHSFSDAARIMGADNSLNVGSFTTVLKDHAAYNGTAHSTSDFRPYRFVIPELFLDLIRTNYLHDARWPQWTASNIFVATGKKIVAGRLINDNPVLTEIQEGADIPLDAIEVAQKFVDTKKFGVGVRITNELLNDSVIDLVTLVLQGVTSKMNLGEDTRAFATLINGEQADLSESAPVVGVASSAAGFQEEDFDNVRNRMTWLNMAPNRIIYSSDDAKADLNATKQDRPRLTIAAYTGINSDIWSLPDDQLIMLDSNTCMVRLQYGSFTVEEEYMPKNQTNAIYFSFNSGFMILKRDARVIMDKSVDFTTLGFPEYMDINAYIDNGGFMTF